MSRVPLPTSEDTLTLWITAMLHEGKSVNTVQTRISGVLSHLADAGCPVERGRLMQLVRTARRHAKPERRKRPITAEELWKIARVLDPSTVRGTRDRAIVVLGFASACRRSEIAALDMADIEFVRQGLLIHLRRSKTDQHGEGRDIGIHRGERADTCPVRGLQAWIAVRGSQPGPLFYAMKNHDLLTERRMPPEGIADVVKATTRKIGLDPSQYGGHSLRSGFVTCAGENGATELAIMKRTGHKRSASVHRYMRPVTAFTTNPLAGKL